MEGIKILVIDDEPSVHYMLEESFPDYQMIYARNGQDGVRLMELEKPHLVLLDVMMPEMDGFDTLAAINKKPRIAEIPILFLTGSIEPHLKVKGLELGADDYITKPFDISELQARIKVSLRKTARFHRGSGDLIGNLSDISLLDLLQSLAMSSKTATVLLPEMDAVIYLEEGMLVCVRQGFFEKEEALERIFFMEKGGFSVRFEDLPADVEKSPQPLTGVLMKTLSVTDEVRDIIRKLNEKLANRRLIGNFSTLGIPNSSQIKEGTTLEDLVCRMKGNMKSSLGAIVKWIRSGLLEVIE